MNVLPVCVSVHYTCAWFLHIWEETIGSPGTGDADGCKLPCESEARGTWALSHWVNPLGPFGFHCGLFQGRTTQLMEYLASEVRCGLGLQSSVLDKMRHWELQKGVKWPPRIIVWFQAGKTSNMSHRENVTLMGHHSTTKAETHNPTQKKYG